MYQAFFIFDALSVYTVPTLGGPISSIASHISAAMYSPGWRSEPTKEDNYNSLHTIRNNIEHTESLKTINLQVYQIMKF